MKNKKAYTTIGMVAMIAIVILIFGIMIPVIFKDRTQEISTIKQSEKSISIQTGDMVYIESLNVTGKVNYSSKFTSGVIFKDNNNALHSIPINNDILRRISK